MEIKSYTFSNGIKATQDELTIEQDYKLMELLLELGVEEGQDILKTPLKNIVKVLVKNDLASKFFGIILQTEADQPEADWKKLKNSEVEEVMTDFFSLNPVVHQLLKNFGRNQDTSNMNMTSSVSNEPAGNTIPDS